MPSRWENLDRGQCRFQPIKFVNLVILSPCKTKPYNKLIIVIVIIIRNMIIIIIIIIIITMIIIIIIIIVSITKFSIVIGSSLAFFNRCTVTLVCNYSFLIRTFCNFIDTINRSFAVYDHMVQKPPCWKAKSPLGHPKQKNIKLSSFVLDVSDGSLLSSMLFIRS